MSTSTLEPLAEKTAREAVEVSIVVPCLNEELTVGEFVDWCTEGLAAAGVSGEVLIVDSSRDRSPLIAAEHGARVLRVPQRGLGRAYIDAIPHVRGDIAIMGDCDLTYDFRELDGFITAIRRGHDFVMGTRTKGEIEPGAMPGLHRYFGSPLTTLLFNVIYGTRVQRHPLRDAGDHARGPAADGAGVPRLGVRLRDDPQGAQAADAHDRGPRALLEGPRGTREPPAPGRLADTLDRRLGQPARDVPLRT